MSPFEVVTGVVAPLLAPNIDTDAIIPSREMKGVGKAGLAEGLFAGWRYTDIKGRTPSPDFVLNDPRRRGATILLGGVNFGCGSSREHAVWALAEYGFRAVLAPSFSPIFQNNCLRNGVLAAVLDEAFIALLADQADDDPQTRQVTIDLPRQVVIAPDGACARFAIGAEAKAMLVDGLDAIDATLARLAEITRFRVSDREERPWAYLAREVAAGV
jgi:3-isopropylmalate/(R)-2-methylmalate dehydratase small subunit